MTSRLLKAQWKFSRMLPRLLMKAYSLGYEVSLGEAYRSPEEAHRLSSLRKGISNSLHSDRLAIDLNLFLPDGTWLKTTDDHQALGEFWESIGGTWGGRFGDGNHYSLAYGGRK